MSDATVGREPVRSQQCGDARQLVLHVVYRFDVGGLENGVVNIINHMPANAYRHAVLALTEATDFQSRIVRPGVPVLAMHKPPGHALSIYGALFSAMRRLRPAIVHSRNLAALEALVPAWAAGVRVRIHGEHGRDVDDLHGASRKHRWIRRAYRPFVGHYVALGDELSDYLVTRIGVEPSRVSRIWNGVDTTVFKPEGARNPALVGCPFQDPRHWLVGTVGRMQSVKNQTSLASAFVLSLQRDPELRQRLRLVMVGDGPLREASLAILERAGMRDLAWLPGERNDVAALMRQLNCFVLPSLAEGISNTILEAMATGLPVIATAVGANASLVQHGQTGEIVPPGDIAALADSICRLASRPAHAAAMGEEGRMAVEARFGLRAMALAYQSLYDTQLSARGFKRRLEPGRS